MNYYMKPDYFRETGASSLNFGHNTFIKYDRTETSPRASLILPAKKGASLIHRILKTQEWGKYDGDEPRRGEL